MRDGSRGRFHLVMGEELKVKNMTAGLISGYNRDVQLTKGPVFAGVGATVDCLRAMELILGGIGVNEKACAAGISQEMHATERALELVSSGVPFRDAYRMVGKLVNAKRDQVRPAERGK